MINLGWPYIKKCFLRYLLSLCQKSCFYHQRQFSSDLHLTARLYCLYSLFFLLIDLSKLFVSQGFLKEFRALPLIVLKETHVSNKPVYLSIKIL